MSDPIADIRYYAHQPLDAFLHASAGDPVRAIADAMCEIQGDKSPGWMNEKERRRLKNAARLLYEEVRAAGLDFADRVVRRELVDDETSTFRSVKAGEVYPKLSRTGSIFPMRLPPWQPYR